MSLLEFCRWLQYSAPLHAMRQSPIFFPIVATIHLMGLALIGGAVLVVDLRLLGFGVPSQPTATVADDAQARRARIDSAVHHRGRGRPLYRLSVKMGSRVIS